MGNETSDRVRWDTRWTITKYKAGDSEPYAKDEIDGNLTLDEGYQLLIDLIAGTGAGSPWDNSHAHIGVGDGTEPSAPGQTGLLGANKTYKPMDATWPRRTGKSCIWRATFGPGEAEYPWVEFTIANGPDDSAVNLNRKVNPREAKPPGETWAMELEMIFGKTEG